MHKDTPLEQINEFTYLRMAFDTRLSWKNHIAKIAEGASKRLNLLKLLAGSLWSSARSTLNTTYKMPSERRDRYKLTQHDAETQPHQYRATIGRHSSHTGKEDDKALALISASLLGGELTLFPETEVAEVLLPQQLEEPFDVTMVVWTQTAVQLFYSLGPSRGGLTTLSSYNYYECKYSRDVVLLPPACGFTAVFGGSLPPFGCIADCESESSTALVNLVSRQHNWLKPILMASVSLSTLIYFVPLLRRK
nr:sodium and chloride dependent glycine [Hymenolepis microstoma]